MYFNHSLDNVGRDRLNGRTGGTARSTLLLPLDPLLLYARITSRPVGRPEYDRLIWRSYLHSRCPASISVWRGVAK